MNDTVTLDSKVPVMWWGLRPHAPSSSGSLALALSSSGEVSS
ncbi:MAG: hypothetical protein ACK5OX_05855 [Desertimonas sp.]